MYEKGQLSADNLSQYYEDNFYEQITSLSFGKNDPTERLYNAGYDYFCNVNIDKNSCVMVEEDFVFNLKGRKFRGIVDLVLKDGDDFIMLDHKTSEYPFTKKGAVKKSKTGQMDGYTKQLAIYAYGLKQCFNIVPKEIGWNFIREGKIYKMPLTDDIVNDAVDWAADTIDKIYNTTNFEKSGSFMMCSKLCDFRRLCGEDEYE